jgi:MFS family permease
LILMLAGLAIASGGNLLTGLAWSIPVAFGMQAIRGSGISLIEVGNNTVIQRLVPAPMQGRVFANLYGAVGLAAGLSYVVGGYLLDATGPRTVLIAAGVGGLAVTAATWLRLSPDMHERPGPEGPG